MMDKRLTVIYADAAEKFVKNVVLYGNEGVLYYDEACTEAVNGAELQNLFLKGLLVFNHADGEYVVPTSFMPSNTTVEVTCGESVFANPIVNEEVEEVEEAE